MTLIRNLKAFISTSKEPLKKGRALVHFTSDDLGETLSVMAEGVQISMKYKYIEDMVKRERDMHYTDGHLIIDETDEADEPEQESEPSERA